MNEQEQRIIIAEACGTLKEGWWCPVCKCAVDSINVTYNENHDERYGGCGAKVKAYPSPDYLHDLNAMREAEKTLETNLRDKFVNELTLPMPYFADGGGIGWYVAHAAAAQRAEAFLRTIGKWRD